ncbi:MAG: hypothetical protein PVH00_09600 [Gemmatimonadota bacterium]
MRVLQLSVCFVLLTAPATGVAQHQELPIREDLRLGVVDGPPELQLHQIGGIAVRPNGDIVVLDNGSSEVRLFSADGRFLRRFGGRGEGPGEFKPPAWMSAGAEHVVVMDQNARATFFRMDGTVDHTLPLYGPGRPSLNVIAQGRDGWLATVREPGASSAKLDPGELREDSTSIHVIDVEDGTVGPLVLRYAARRRVGAPGGAPSEGSAIRPLFSSDPVLGVDGRGRLFVTDGNAYRITVHAPDGAATREIAPAHTPRPVENAYIDRYAELVRGMFAAGDFWNPELQMKSTIDDRVASPHPESLPATGDLRVAGSGALWVERVDLMEDPGAWEFRRTFPRMNADRGGSRPPATVWDVFDASGGLRGSVSLPERFQAYAATDDAIIGVLQDTMDVEYVVRFRIQS